MTAIIVVASFFLDALFLNVFTQNTIFCPLISLMCLVIVYPLLKENDKKYLVICGGLGFFYDVSFTNTLFLHTLLFIAYGFGIRELFKQFPIDFINTYLVGIIGIVSYRILLIFIFFLLGYTYWNFRVLLYSIEASILLNSLYLLVFYFLVKKLRRKKRLYKYRLLKIKKQ